MTLAASAQEIFDDAHHLSVTVCVELMGEGDVGGCIPQTP